MIYASSAERFFREFPYPSKIYYVGFYHRNPIDDDPVDKVPIDKVIMKSDLKIMDTVLHFIFAILKDRHAVVAFNYSALGGRDVSRKILFRRKYNIYNQNNHHRIDIDLRGDDVMTIIFRKDNINFVELCTMTSNDIYL